MAAARFCLPAVLLLAAAVHARTEASCPEIGTIRKNNWPETETGYITSTSDATGVTEVIWAPYDPSSDYIDASLYVTVAFNQTSQTIDFTALPSMAGVRDYPETTPQLGGTCQMTCGSDTGEFDFFMTVTDQNTATPIFDSATYSVDVIETLPTGFTIPDLVIFASDYDADQGNYEISFTLQESSPFSLTGAVKTSDAPPTYSTQLVLDETLDYTVTPSYQLTVTAQDPGGLSSEANITVNVIDTDTRQPEFDQSVYTVTVDDPEVPGPLNVSIRAVDPDAPGKVIYELHDSTGGQFAEYFSLDPDTAELNLTKDITPMLQPYVTTISFLLEATEDGGNHFSCRADLLITLPAGPPPGCPALSSVNVTNWPEDRTGQIMSQNASGVTHAYWAPQNGSSTHLDASGYVAVNIDTEGQQIEFTALPTMDGIVDFGSQTYPDPVLIEGTCLVECSNDRAEFRFTLTVNDTNTASPVFSSDPYTVHVRETFPVGLVIGNLVISATDADADQGNYEISFSLQEGSPFSLTEAVKTSAMLPTYDTQLVLDEPLDHATNSSYSLTVTAQNPDRIRTDATINVHVLEVN